MLDIDTLCRVLSTKRLIKTTWVCIIGPEKESKFCPILLKDIAKKGYEESHFHMDEQVPDRLPSHLICRESTAGCNDWKSRRLRTVISLKWSKSTGCFLKWRNTYWTTFGSHGSTEQPFCSSDWKLWREWFFLCGSY